MDLLLLKVKKIILDFIPNHQLLIVIQLLEIVDYHHKILDYNNLNQNYKQKFIEFQVLYVNLCQMFKELQVMVS